LCGLLGCFIDIYCVGFWAVLLTFIVWAVGLFY
jgi:hypothetical protein